VAEKWLNSQFGIEIVAWVSSVSNLAADPAIIDINTITRQQVDSSAVRCPDLNVTNLMVEAIKAAKEDKDSLGGVITCVCRNVPVGWGEPCFDKLEALLAHAMLSIPATKGFEIGSGFEGTKLRGSLHNDPFILKENGKLGTKTNNSGGIQGGISNGENIIFRVAFKPPATIGKAQETSEYLGVPALLKAEGRHDPCVVPRAVAIVEGMAAIVLADPALIQLSRQSTHRPLNNDFSHKIHQIYTPNSNQYSEHKY